MPPKRRPKPQPTDPPPMPPPPPEPDAARVRKEWSNFIDAWYEPHKKKLVEKLQKELLTKYKNLGPPKDTAKLREMELFEKLDAIAQQLAQPARSEWERRLDQAHLREDQWDDMSAEEQQAVMGVFVGFFDDVEDMHDIALDDAARQTIPPTPTRGNFEFVNPTSFFVDTMTPPNPSRNLPALSMDHLATLGPSNPARTADPLPGGVGATLGFQNWASEVGIVQQPPIKSRPRATDMSRQASGASNLSSPFSKTTSPQYSPPIPTTKFSPPSNPEALPLGKRYIGPVITEEEADPLDEELLKSRMADDYQQYKISLRVQMIYQFHEEAAAIEIKLVESLLADQGTKESRARAVQEHETSMMRLREQKEEDRKRLCAEEREKRRQEMRLHLAQRRPQPPASRSGKAHQKENVPLAPAKLELPSLMKKSASVDEAASEILFTNVQQRPKATHQKENVPLTSAKLELPSLMKKSWSMDEAPNEALFANLQQRPKATKDSAKLEPPGAIKKSTSMLSQDEVAANEALFADAMAKMQGKVAQANEAEKPRPQEDVPVITVSLAEAAPAAQAPKGKKGKKAAAAVKPAEEAAPLVSDATAGVAKSAWGAPSTLKPDPDPPKAKKPSTKKGKKVTVMEEPDVDAPPLTSARGKAKAVEAPVAKKPQLKVSIVEDAEESAPVGRVIEPEPESLATTSEGEMEPGASEWFSPESMTYWANMMAGPDETPAPAPEPAGKHVRWTPTVNESDDEGEEGLEANLWMQYAISGGEIPSLAEEKKPGDATVFDRAALAGWPKMEWMRGQSSGSARVF